ncbi:hypothetical protein Godav_001378 [Gossypium davidsonii]|uniref:RNase H type-1 domain-containing protein n=1 Tax=Gossypium davidsonii TaxID=34287 RepID=A0A7J8T3B4_GOSDV|nr:hypothetical protein [Gossypium davidsonii]
MMTYQKDDVPSYGDPFLRVRRGFRSSSACGLCGHDHEDVLYVLRDCHAARAVWDKLIPQQSLSRFYTGFLLEWYSSVSMPLSHKSRSYLHNWSTTSRCVCLNTDGSVRINEGFATDRGCVTNHNGEWIIGFSRYLGNCIVLEVELWGILDGLNLTLDRCFKRILIQTDSIEAINAIMEDSSENSNSTIVKRIHHTLKRVK